MWLKCAPLLSKLITYTGILAEAVVTTDMSSTAGRALHSSSDETGCFAGALSSAKNLGEKM